MANSPLVHVHNAAVTGGKAETIASTAAAAPAAPAEKRNPEPIGVPATCTSPSRTNSSATSTSDTNRMAPSTPVACGEEPVESTSPPADQTGPPPRNKGRVPYTSVVIPDGARSPTTTCSAEVAGPLIRRRRRIGRPFSARSPLGWNEAYLSTPVRSKDDYGASPPNSSIYTDYDDIAIPSLSPERQLRHRRTGDDGSAQFERRVAKIAKEEAYVDARYRKVQKHQMSFAAFRINYLVVHIAIMLADGLQGTHLYVLYEGYGYSVASLYCLGFVSGAITSPFIGPFVDKIGRKNSAMLYCALEMFINWLEQFPYFYGLIASRVIGGITTNLLFSVFESWLVTEHRRRGYTEDKLETILRDSVILSNLAAIASGFLAEFLAVKFGAVGPFEGAVMCTAVALLLVMSMWRENYGSDVPGVKSVRGYMAGAFKTIVDDTNISRIGLIQGLTEGSLQTFVFLWSPALARFAASAPSTAVGLDSNGEPAYGLIFGAFMACGVAGGLSEPYVRKIATYLVRDHDRRAGFRRRDTVIIEGEGEVKPAAVEFMTTAVYVGCACLLLIPYLLPADGTYSFTVSLVAFLVYEFMVGLYMPCEGVIRSIYMPTSSVCSVMTMLRVIVNIAVALGVISTNYVPFTTAFAALSTLMLISAGMQVSMVDTKEWSNFVRRISSLHFPSFVEDVKQGLVDSSITESAPSPLGLSPDTSMNFDTDEAFSEDTVASY